MTNKEPWRQYPMPRLTGRHNGRWVKPAGAWLSGSSNPWPAPTLGATSVRPTLIWLHPTLRPCMARRGDGTSRAAPLHRCTSAVSCPFHVPGDRGITHAYTPSPPLGKIASPPSQAMTRPTAGTHNRQTMQGPHGSAGYLGGRISRYTRPDPISLQLRRVAHAHAHVHAHVHVHACAREADRPFLRAPTGTATVAMECFSGAWRRKCLVHSHVQPNLSFSFVFCMGAQHVSSPSRVDPPSTVDLRLPGQASRSALFPRDAGKWPHDEASACAMDASADM
jgi:hypothetical protein